MTDIAKCNLKCEKSGTCGYAKSSSVNVYDFKNVCKDKSMYFEHFEGNYREVPKVEEVKIEEINPVECEGDRGEDHVCEVSQSVSGVEGE